VKILYLITKSNWGGAQRYVFDLATHLPEGYEAVVASRGNDLLAQKLREHNVRFVTTTSLGIYNLIRKEKPDIVHTNSSVFGGLGSFFAWVNRVPKIIFTAHGWPFNENRNLLWRVMVYKLSWLTALFCDKVITITKSDFGQGKRMPFVGHKMYLINNSIEQINFFEKKESREKLGLNQNEIIVGTIAELTPNKGLEYLASAAEKVPGVEFAVIGDGELREKLSTTKLNLVGFVPEASRYLRAFDIFVLPSLKEGLPYVLLEAGQAGLPVVASNVGGIPDIIGDVGMLVPPKNAELLARAIKTLIDNPKLRSDLGTQVGYRVSNLFNFDKFLSQTYELYISP